MAQCNYHNLPEELSREYPTSVLLNAKYCLVGKEIPGQFALARSNWAFLGTHFHLQSILEEEAFLT